MQFGRRGVAENFLSLLRLEEANRAFRSALFSSYGKSSDSIEP